jgi:hypothetical protein
MFWNYIFLDNNLRESDREEVGFWKRKKGIN